MIDASTWGWPQWTWVIIALIGLLGHAANHGKPRETEWNGFMSLISFGLSIFILSQGGFFG